MSVHSSFSFITEKHSILRMHSSRYLFISEAHARCFQILAVTERAAINICVQVFVWTTQWVQWLDCMVGLYNVSYEVS